MPKKKVAVCTWTQDDDGSDLWETDCGHAFCLDEGSPVEDNGFKFCVYCGNPIEDEPYSYEDDQEQSTGEADASESGEQCAGDMAALLDEEGAQGEDFDGIERRG